MPTAANQPKSAKELEEEEGGADAQKCQLQRAQTWRLLGALFSFAARCSLFGR